MMATKTLNNLKLGVFVIAGLLLMIYALYRIGQDTNMFGNNYTLLVRFENVHGLTSGNNVRFAGIQVGTVKKVKILSDTLIEVSMLIESRMKDYIRKSDVVSMSTDGLMGNRILNISSARDGSPLARDGDVLISRRNISTDEMLGTLDRTNRNIADISEELRATVLRINQSAGIWKLLADPALPENLRIASFRIRQAGTDAAGMMQDLNALIRDVKDGKGSLGVLLTDTSLSVNLNQALLHIRRVGEEAAILAEKLGNLVTGLQQDMQEGKGTAQLLLKDSTVARDLRNSLEHLEKGTDAFRENMEALQHNILLRGYFRKLEKNKQREQKKAAY